MAENVNEEHFILVVQDDALRISLHSELAADEVSGRIFPHRHSMCRHEKI
jgi:hypothetical protein